MRDAGLPDDTMDFDMPCTACGYNLRWARAGGQCPECGQRNMVTLETYVRRSSFRKVDLRDFSRVPTTMLRHVRVGAAYALVANLLVVAGALAPESWHARYTPTRAAILYALCGAIGFGALAVYRHGRAARPAWLRIAMYLGAFSAVGFIAMVGISADARGADSFAARWLGGRGKSLSEFAQFLGPPVAVGMACRVGLQQWWLRLEGRSWLAWPLLFCAVPAVVFWAATPAFARDFAAVSDWRIFNSLDSLAYFPTASNGWMGEVSTVIHEVALRGAWQFWPFVLFCLFLAAQAWVILGDAALWWLATAALRRQTGPAKDAPGGGRA